MDLEPILARFTGRLTCEQIAQEASRAIGQRVPVDIVVKLATDLEDRLFAFGAPYQAARARIEREFADADVREASHAGSAYHGEPDKLADYIDNDCFGVAGDPARPKGGQRGPKGANGSNGRSHERLVALIAPHIDPWRGARCYGEAYGVLANALPTDVETFVLFGTSHAPMEAPFALCRKAFDTPFGHVAADHDSIDFIAGACDFDPYADQFNHKREHSLEFQVVFLKHLLGRRRARIIPILAGLGEHQWSATSPKKSKSVERFYEAVRTIVHDKRAVVVAGADLAHVGPRFGDAQPLDDRQRRSLDATDRESLDFATRLDAEGFFRHVAGDLDTRRVCGLAPIYSLLRTVSDGARGRLGHYEQTVDPEEGSIVSHAAVGFYE